MDYDGSKIYGVAVHFSGYLVACFLGTSCCACQVISCLLMFVLFLDHSLLKDISFRKIS